MFCQASPPPIQLPPPPCTGPHRPLAFQAPPTRDEGRGCHGAAVCQRCVPHEWRRGRPGPSMLSRLSASLWGHGDIQRAHLWSVAFDVSRPTASSTTFHRDLASLCPFQSPQPKHQLPHQALHGAAGLHGPTRPRDCPVGLSLLCWVSLSLPHRLLVPRPILPHPAKQRKGAGYCLCPSTHSRQGHGHIELPGRKLNHG